MIPIYASDQNYLDAIPKYIIIHHTAELNVIPTGAKIDTNKFQVNKIRNYLYKYKQTRNIPYHYIIDKVDNDYEIINAQPFISTIDFFDDIPLKYKNSIHIAVLGNYNEDIPEFRLYQRMAYNLISPLMTMFRIVPDNILLHSDLSNIDCPGEYFSKQKLLSYVRLYQKRKFINRK